MDIKSIESFLEYIGDENLLMGYVHIAHDCRIGNHNILANYTGLSGHVTLENYVTLGGQNGVAQFLSVGSYVYTGSAKTNIDKRQNYNQISSQFTMDSLISLNYFIYSLVPIFYLFLSINFIGKSLMLLGTKYNKNLLSIIVFGCGVSYFAFERFSMSHAYEFFSTSFLIFLSVSYEKNKFNSSLISFSIPVFMFLALSLRWSNYFVFTY